MQSLIYFKTTEKEQRFYLANDLPLIIRLDGKNVTKEHKKYNLLDNQFSDKLIDSVISVMTKYDCRYIVFAIMDEISIIILNASDIFKYFDDTNSIYIGALFSQDVCMEFDQYYEGTRFGISVFNLSLKDVPEYIKCRKKCGNIAAYHYFAKETLTFQEMQEHPLKNILELKGYLFQKGYYDTIVQNKRFFQGRLINFGCNEIFLKRIFTKLNSI